MATFIINSVTQSEYSLALAKIEDALDEPVSFLQATTYATMQKADGKKVVYITITDDDSLIGCGIGVRYTAPGSLSYLYFPYGPIVTTYSQQIIDSLGNSLKSIAKDLGCAFVRLDNSNLTLSSSVSPVSDAIASMSSLQPRLEWVLPIGELLDTIWMSLHKHARYNVRLAERANAQIETFSPPEAPLDVFYELMRTTAGRDSFSIFDKSYYEAVLQNVAADEGFVAICTIDGKPAAAALFVVHDLQSHYVFAGSSDDFRKIAPAYFLLWKAIEHSKEVFNCELFNFGGIQDPVKKLHLSGVTSFKKRFGGYQEPHANPIDIVYSRIKYAAFAMYKKCNY